MGAGKGFTADGDAALAETTSDFRTPANLAVEQVHELAGCDVRRGCERPNKQPTIP